MGQRDILISGAGIAGPALAYWLVRAGFKPFVLERAPSLRVGGHSIDIRGAAVDVVERMGLLERIRDARTRIATLSVVTKPGKPTIDLEISRFDQMRRTRDLEIVRDDLVRILYEATRHEVAYRFGDTVEAIEENTEGVRVRFRSGETRTFGLVVGADGQHSRTRELVFGPEASFAHPIDAAISVFTIENLTGRRDAALIHNKPGIGMAVYTLADNVQAKAVLLFRDPPTGRALLDPEVQRALLRERFTGQGWYADPILEALETAPDFYFDALAQIRMDTWSHGRVVLLGDAAHGPSPLSGQGTTLALVGALLLADALAGHPGHPPDAFASYERQMRAFVQMNQEIANDGIGLLVPGSRLGVWFRNLAFRAAPLFARWGAGFAGKLERASREVELPPHPGRFDVTPPRQVGGTLSDGCPQAEREGGGLGPHGDVMRSSGGVSGLSAERGAFCETGCGGAMEILSPLQEDAQVLVLTGAGISAESGVPTFRDARGLWRTHRFEDVASPEGFARDPALVWQFYSERRQGVNAVAPNAAHRALVTLEEALGDRFLLVTQNVDGLHREAGSRRLIELHGELFKTRCSNCSAPPFEDRGLYLEGPCPTCPSCGVGMLRPHIVWFGEVLDEAALARIDGFMSRAGPLLHFFAVGTSGSVFPAAALVGLARRQGARTCLINAEAADNGHAFEHFIEGRAVGAVPRLVDRLLGGT